MNTSGLVQSLADTQWRLHRIPSLENGIWALGRLRRYYQQDLRELRALQAERKHGERNNSALLYNGSV